MVKKKKIKKTKKSRITIRDPKTGSEVIQVFDYSKFKKVFNQWKDDCKKSGEDLRSKSSATLFEMVENHGTYTSPHRPNKGNSNGAGKIVEQLNKLISNSEKLDTNDTKFIDDAISKLEQVAKTNNPRNIPYTIPRTFNRKTFEYDTESDVDVIYGHYRTSNYIKFRNAKAAVRENMEPEKGKAAPETWTSTKKNTAKPPMWQALFADGDGDVVKTGLLPVLIEAKNMTKDVELEELIIKIDDDGKGATARDLLKIPAFKDKMVDLMGTEGSPGPGTNPTTGNLRDSHLSRTAIPQLKFEVNSLKQSDFLKDLAGHEDTIGTLQSFSVIISRRQVRNIGLLLGFKRVEGKKDTVYLPGVVKKMDWRQIVKGEIYG
tara:strand:- start:806 stop:1930 length:1125 start_codon:yes stop_codon:yes gene_type:complete